jgi:hypothetical protein
MIKVCYVAHAHEYLIIAPVAKLLTKKGIEFCFVCKTPDTTDFYNKNNFQSFNITPEVFDKKEDISEKEKEELDLKYGSPGIREICDSDVQLKSLFGSDYKAKEQIVARSIKFWENFFDKNKIDYLMMLETATFSSRPAYLVSRKRNIPILIFAVGPDAEHFCMDDIGETYAWKELINSLDEKNKTIFQKEKKLVLDFVNKRIQKVSKMPIFFAPESLFKSIKNLIGLWARDNAKNRKKNPIWVAGLNYGREQLWGRIKWSYFTKFFFKYDEPQKGEKYVYFPFFSGKETSYLTNDMYYGENEISIIKEVARSLPLGYFLYTKEHPFNPGDFTFSQLKELKKSSNIKVLHSFVSSQELIDNCSAVVTVEGTVGWEGLLSKKPVVCIGGMPFYAHSSLVYKVGNLNYLPSILYEAIRKGSKIYKNKEEEWFWFINKVMTTCGNGAILESGTPHLMTNNENIKNIAASLLEKIERNLKNKIIFSKTDINSKGR